MAHPIDTFFNTSSKALNDSTNKQREAYLATLIEAGAASDDARVVALRTAWLNALTSLCPAVFEKITVKKKGGRGANYDFLVTYQSDTGDIIYRQPIEFKYGGIAISSHPQFLSLAEKAIPFPITYAEYFYTRHMPDFCSTDEELSAAPIPEKAFYLAKVYGCSYTRHQFFLKAKDRSEHNKAAKKAVVDASIAGFLEEYGPSCPVATLTEIFKAKELGKVFLLWDKDAGVFHMDRFTEEDLTVTEYVGIRGQNTLVVRSATREFRLLLRWKNHAGVLYPAWQISVASR